MTPSLDDKEEEVRRILAQHGRVAVAFSGGADSSLLLRLAVDVLGSGKVLALTARSCLLSERDLANAETWVARHGLAEWATHLLIDVQPLSWDEFAANPPDRCYQCKSRVYGTLLAQARQQGRTTLLDGTNADDLCSDRPGLRVLGELDIISPLAAAGLSKEEVRQLGRKLGLDNWNAPSASCLATRIPAGLTITTERLTHIGSLEDYLVRLGFPGCRVRLDSWQEDTVYVAVQEEDLARLASSVDRSDLLNFFSDSGAKKVFLDLRGR